MPGAVGDIEEEPACDATLVEHPFERNIKTVETCIVHYQVDEPLSAFMNRSTDFNTPEFAMHPSYQPRGEIVLAASHGKAIRVAAGTLVKVTNPHGTQAVDFWAFNGEDPTEYLSTEHVHSVNSAIPINKGSRIVSNQRRPMVSIVEDTSTGDHDTLLGACNPPIYAELGCKDYHRNCSDNLREGLAELGIEVSHTPGPVNLFFTVRANPDGTLTRMLPASEPGSHIIFRAEMDVVLAFSACPQDITTINGPDRTVRDCLIEVLADSKAAA